MTVAVFPGSFDPITLGHMNIISRAANVFDKVIVCVIDNSEKKYLFTAEQRIKFAEASVAHLKNVKALSYDGLLTDFMSEVGSNILIKGVRNAHDLDYEYMMERANKTLREDIEVLYLMSDPEFIHMSSTVAREMIKHNKKLDCYLPSAVAKEVGGKSFGRK